MGDYVKAEAFYKRALVDGVHLLSPKHRDTLTVVGGLGWLYESMGEYTKAEDFFNRALEACERLLGPEHPETLAICYNLLDREAEALTHLDALLDTLSNLQELDEDEQWLQAEAIELRQAIT